MKISLLKEGGKPNKIKDRKNSYKSKDKRTSSEILKDLRVRSILSRQNENRPCEGNPDCRNTSSRALEKPDSLTYIHSR